MACNVKQNNEVGKKMMRQLKKENPTLTNPQIKQITDELLTSMTDTAEVKVPDIVKANAITESVPDILPEYTVKEPVLKLSRAYEANPSIELQNKLLVAETEAGMRNAKGEMIVEPIYPRTQEELEVLIGSSGDPTTVPLTTEEAETVYLNRDGTIDNITNTNEVMKQLDKDKFGELYDEDWSVQLDKVLGEVKAMVKDIDDTKLKITKSTTKKAANGTYSTLTGEVLIELDTLDKDAGAEFRNRFTQTNQEVLVHEVVHSVLDFAFNSNNLKDARNVAITNLLLDVKKIYKLARENSTWEDLLVGVIDPTTYEIAQAKERYEYIFNNEGGNGLHEFAAHLMTNKQFANAMNMVETKVKYGDKRTASRVKQDEQNKVSLAPTDEGTDLVSRILNLISKLINSIVELVTKTDGTITTSGARLLLKLMNANEKNGTVAIAHQELKVSKRSMDYIEEQSDKFNKVVNKYEEKVANKVEESIDFIAAKTDATIERKKFKQEFAYQQKKFRRRMGNVSEEKRAVAEKKADVLATLETKRVLQERHRKFLAKLEKAVNKYKQTTTDNNTSKGIKAAKWLINIPNQLNILYRFHQLSRGVYGVKGSEALATQYKHVAEQLNFAEGTIFDGIIGDFLEKDYLATTINDAILVLKHKVDAYRESMYEDVLHNTKQWFGNVNLHHKDNLKYDRALSDVILRTDIQALGLDARGLLKLLQNPDNLKKQIADLKKGLHEHQLRDIVSVATGMVTGSGLISNAENIAQQYGANVLANDQVSKVKVKQIDKLITLIALDMTDQKIKNDMIDFMTAEGYEQYEKRMTKKFVGLIKNSGKLNKTEYKHQIFNGVDNFIHFSRGMQNSSKKEMALEGHNYVKGYVKETYNKDIVLNIFPLEEREMREKEGYVFKREMDTPLAQGRKQGIFVSRDLTVKKVNGALGLQGMKQRGTNLSELIRDEYKNSSMVVQEQAFEIEFERQMKMYRAGDSDQVMYPTYNEIGNIVNFRMFLNRDDKLEFIDMETRGSQNIARSYGTTSTAKKSNEHNRGLLRLLHEDYVENYKTNSSNYVTIYPINPSSEDYDLITDEEKELSKLWARLPQHTKNVATKLWGEKQRGKVGKGKIIVRKDLLTPLFGYDELSIINLDIFQEASPKVRHNLRMAEKGWQDLMQIAKSNIVIKTPEVMVDNILSNAKILFYLGVNPIKGTKLMVLAFKELKRYKEDVREIRELQRRVLAGEQGLTRRISELKREIEGNTVRPIIKAGLFQSIVEDVNTQDDSNQVAHWAKNKVNEWIPNETANTVLQYTYLSSKTKVYQAMLSATQMGDFIFRYTQYHDAINNKGKSAAEALRGATDNYVNYDAPMSPLVHYLDRMGPAAFVKYFTRIQHVLVKFLRTHPLRVATDMTQEFFLGDSPDIFDAGLLERGLLAPYNPFKVWDHLMQVVTPPGGELAYAFAN